MQLNLPWQVLEPFLKTRRNQSAQSCGCHKGRYLKLVEWFKDKEFNANNFDMFLFEEVDQKGKSDSLYNNYLKLVKHLAVYYKIKEEFADYKYRDDHAGQPEDILTPEQITQLAECKIKYERFKSRKEKHRALIYFLGHMGSRIDETLHLEWTDIKQDDKDNLVHFRKEITKAKSGERYVPIPTWLMKLVLNLPHENQYIFSKIAAANFRNDLVKRQEKCKILFKIKPHTFRDSYTNNELEYDIPLEQVTNLLGHSDTRVTYRSYVKVKAKKVARNLRMKDPAFIEDQTYDMLALTAKENVEGLINHKICRYVSESVTLPDGKRELIMHLIEQ